MGLMIILMLLGILLAAIGIAYKPPQRSWRVAVYGIGLSILSSGVILRWWNDRLCFAWILFLFVCIIAMGARSIWPSRWSYFFGGVALTYLMSCLAIITGF